jgi:hypothetical protein
MILFNLFGIRELRLEHDEPGAHQRLLIFVSGAWFDPQVGHQWHPQFTDAQCIADALFSVEIRVSRPSLGLEAGYGPVGSAWPSQPDCYTGQACAILVPHHDLDTWYLSCLAYLFPLG